MTGVQTCALPILRDDANTLLYVFRFRISSKPAVMDNFSGTHVPNTGTIAYFKIISEAGIAAGVRRIEALTSEGLMKHYQEVEEELQEAARTAKTTPSALTSKIQSLLEEIKTLHSENEKLKSKLANDSLGDVMSQVKDRKSVV